MIELRVGGEETAVCEGIDFGGLVEGGRHCGGVGTRTGSDVRVSMVGSEMMMLIEVCGTKVQNLHLKCGVRLI